MKITKEHVGKRVRKSQWMTTFSLTVLYVGEAMFFALNSDGDEGAWSNKDIWELVPEKKKPSQIIKEKLAGSLVYIEGNPHDFITEHSASYAHKRIDAVIAWLDKQAEGKSE